MRNERKRSERTEKTCLNVPLNVFFSRSTLSKMRRQRRNVIVRENKKEGKRRKLKREN